MRIGARAAFAAAVTVALTAAGPAALAQAQARGGHDGHGTGHASRASRTIPLADSPAAGNPEGIAYDKRSKTFFTGFTGDGTIYRGTANDTTVQVWLPGSAGNSAVGMKVSHGKLYVAGGPTGAIKVYDIATKALLATFATGAGGFLNDLVVTEKGDVWVTDSFRPTLWHVTAAQVSAATGTPEAVDVSASIPFTAGAFNLNGIVATHGGKRLVVVQSNTGALWNVDLRRTPVTITKIDAPAVVGGDGMIVDQGRLVIVTGTPATLTFVKLGHHDSRGRIDRVLTDATLRGPSTVARAKNLYLVVNADFGTSTKPFTIAAIDRRDGRHGGGHH